ncbi:MAG: DUF1287 domain-containing protein [Bacilli bacterium]
MELAITVLLVINLFSFCISGLDKYLAVKNRTRIPEIVLLTISLFGGGFGLLLSFVVFHHKIRKKKLLILVIITVVIWLFLIYYTLPFFSTNKFKAEDFNITVIKSPIDQNNNGLDDYTDILLGAKQEALSHPVYKSAYYKEGYPPAEEGVCTDTVWRAFKNAGYLLKDLVDADIKEHTNLYPNVKGKPDKNIDFRRVKNLKVFFERTSQILTNDIRQIDQWMPGDIVIFGKDYSHIAIISDYRNSQGIPFIIHNAGQKNREENALIYWNQTRGVTGHYRFKGGINNND